MNRPFTVLIDLDSTVYDIWTPVFALEQARSGRIFSGKDILSWNWPYENDVDVSKYWNTKNYFLNLKPYPHAIAAIRKVHDWGIKQVFLTVAAFKYAMEEKMTAVDRDFPFIGHKKVLFTGGDKDLAYGDILVDDGPHNHESFESTGGVSVIAHLQNSPYCLSYTKHKYIMTDWQQYPEIIAKELKGTTLKLVKSGAEQWQR